MGIYSLASRPQRMRDEAQTEIICAPLNDPFTNFRFVQDLKKGYYPLIGTGQGLFWGLKGLITMST